jgi:hypothetical protein
VLTYALTPDDEDRDVHTFLWTFELNMIDCVQSFFNSSSLCSIESESESDSILRLSEGKLSPSEDSKSAVAFKSTSKGKPPILRHTTRTSRFQPQESPLSEPAQSLFRPAAADGDTESGQKSERILATVRPPFKCPSISGRCRSRAG